MALPHFYISSQLLVIFEEPAHISLLLKALSALCQSLFCTSVALWNPSTGSFIALSYTHLFKWLPLALDCEQLRNKDSLCSSSLSNSTWYSIPVQVNESLKYICNSRSCHTHTLVLLEAAETHNCKNQRACRWSWTTNHPWRACPGTLFIYGLSIVSRGSRKISLFLAIKSGDFQTRWVSTLSFC